MSEEIQMLPISDQPAFEEFARDIIRKVAAAHGIKYEQLSADYDYRSVSSWSREIMRVYMDDARKRAILPLLDPRV